jgi:hypothetical protein
VRALELAFSFVIEADARANHVTSHRLTQQQLAWSGQIAHSPVEVHRQAGESSSLTSGTMPDPWRSQFLLA